MGGGALLLAGRIEPRIRVASRGRAWAARGTRPTRPCRRGAGPTPGRTTRSSHSPAGRPGHARAVEPWTSTRPLRAGRTRGGDRCRHRARDDLGPGEGRAVTSYDGAPAVGHDGHEATAAAARLDGIGAERHRRGHLLGSRARIPHPRGATPRAASRSSAVSWCGSSGSHLPRRQLRGARGDRARWPAVPRLCRRPRPRLRPRSPDPGRGTAHHPAVLGSGLRSTMLDRWPGRSAPPTTRVGRIADRLRTGVPSTWLIASIWCARSTTQGSGLRRHLHGHRLRRGRLHEHHRAAPGRGSAGHLDVVPVR